MRLLLNEFEEGFQKLAGDDKERHTSLATGKLAYPFIKRMAERLTEKYPNLDMHVYCIRNDFFGETITVAGLITGQDLKAQLTGQQLGDRLLLPVSMFRNEEDVFLDDMTISQLEEALQVRIDVVKSSGQDLIDAILQMEE